MPLAFSTNAFKKFSLEYAIKSIAQIGYEGVEILCDTPHAYPRAFDANKIKQTRQLLVDLDLEISNLNAFTLYAIGDVYHPSWIEQDEKLTEQRVSHTKACLELAKSLGARNLSTEPGGPLSNSVDRKALQKVFVKNIQKVLPLAEQTGVKILVEPEPGLLIQTSKEFLDFIKQVPNDLVGLNFDIGHFYCVNEDVESIVYKLAEYVGHFHLEDIAANRVHEHLIPGSGAIDFRSIFRAINGTGYKGFVTIELYPYQDRPVDAAKSAFEFVHPLWE